LDERNAALTTAEPAVPQLAAQVRVPLAPRLEVHANRVEKPRFVAGRSLRAARLKKPVPSSEYQRML
jgi:hypothetical protein